ncbi:MAG: FHA domain-containing protein [Bacteroidales bacterium]|nr:FHA domain-containing protein [Bacteroidales bacterium]
MPYIFTIGRRGNQPFEIDPSLTYVHGEHARITISDDYRQWFIEDLKGNGGNGIYLRNANGDFARVYSCRIQPTDIIRLGPEGARSVTFMARRVLDPSLHYEFSYIKSLDSQLRREEDEHNATVKKHTRNSIIAPVAGVVVAALIRLAVPMDPAIMIAMSSMATAGPLAFLRYRYKDDAERLKEIRARRAKIVVCPKCGRQLSDYDVRNSRCSVCKAM